MSQCGWPSCPSAHCCTDSWHSKGDCLAPRSSDTSPSCLPRARLRLRPLPHLVSETVWGPGAGWVLPSCGAGLSQTLASPKAAELRSLKALSPGTDVVGSPGCLGTAPTPRAVRGWGGTGSLPTALPSPQQAGVGGGGAGAAVQHQRLAERGGQRLRALPQPGVVRREPGWRAGRTSAAPPCPAVGEWVPGSVCPPAQPTAAAPGGCLAGPGSSQRLGLLQQWVPVQRAPARVLRPRASVLAHSPWSSQLSLGYSQSFFCKSPPHACGASGAFPGLRFYSPPPRRLWFAFPSLCPAVLSLGLGMWLGAGAGALVLPAPLPHAASCPPSSSDRKSNQNQPWGNSSGLASLENSP